MGVVTWRRRLSEFLLHLGSRLIVAAMRIDPTQIEIELKTFRVGGADVEEVACHA
jgi:hypothetical protein